MDDWEEFLDGVRNPLPPNHQFFQAILGAIAGVAGTQLAHKGYVTGYKIWKSRKR